MKKDNRNCAMGGYPVYPMPMNGMQMPMPGMQMPMQPQVMPYTPATCGNDASLQEQVNNLEKRVARLEGMMQSTAPSYTESNFYMV